MNIWNDIYTKNKKLDNLFDQKYLEIEPQLFEKNCLELSVEIAEFAQETRCFKYWSIKKIKEQEALEECADCVMMLLYFYHYLDTNIDIIEVEEQNILKAFNQSFYLSITVMNECKKETLDRLFGYLLTIIKLLGLQEEALQKACYDKIRKVESRLDSDY